MKSAFLSVIILIVAVWSGTARAELVVTIVEAIPFLPSHAGTWADQNGPFIHKSHDIYPTVPSYFEFGSIDGPVIALQQANFATSGFTFDFQLTLALETGQVAGMNNSIWFVLDEDATYRLSGNFIVADPYGDRVQWDINFYEQTPIGVASEKLYKEWQVHSSKPNVSFAMGVPGGSGYSFDGSLTGTLTAGKTYTLLSRAYIANNQNIGGDVPATAVGRIELEFNPVPEPDSGKGALVALGVVCLIRMGERSRDRRGH